MVVGALTSPTIFWKRGGKKLSPRLHKICVVIKGILLWRIILNFFVLEGLNELLPSELYTHGRDMINITYNDYF